ncbi:hypothetical protein GHT06_020528 [Daphnia sinensis]|uniref:Uncharacterized protein n=1 Tax=Daphnia sinensis TaxID=1820382 RepID=A0AAD5KHV2_9CRUS|nr:hypothetical protein GHT06_020528 [Daphnia sinensis]
MYLSNGYDECLPAAFVVSKLMLLIFLLLLTALSEQNAYQALGCFDDHSRNPTGGLRIFDRFESVEGEGKGREFHNDTNDVVRTKQVARCRRAVTPRQNVKRRVAVD